MEVRQGGKRERARHSRYAKATFRKDRRLNIRLSSKDLKVCTLDAASALRRYGAVSARTGSRLTVPRRRLLELAGAVRWMGTALTDLPLIGRTQLRSFHLASCRYNGTFTSGSGARFANRLGTVLGTVVGQQLSN
jgi:hypothetical protein